MTVINIFDIWQKLMSEVNVQQSGLIRPQIDFENWYNAISNELFNLYIADAERSQQIDDALRPFLKIANVIIVPQTNLPYDLIPYPADYEGFANLKILRPQKENRCFFDPQYPIIDGTGKSRKYEDPDFAQMNIQYATSTLTTNVITKIDTQRWDSCMEHPRKGPSFNAPKCMQYDSGFKVAPKNLQGAILEYYRTPRRAVFAYTIGAGDIVQYDATNSVQLEWSNSILENEFLPRLVKKYGKYIESQSMYQMGENDMKEMQ